jgi:hypothetical protein
MSATKPARAPVSFRLSDEAKALLAKLADHYGVSRTAALEIMIREQARKILRGGGR